MRLLASLCLGLFVVSAASAQPAAKKEYKTIWKKIVLDTKFRSEGVAVADVNGDKKKDILVGDFIYLAPDWKPVAIRKAKTFNPAAGYSEAFAVFADDIDKDGHVDQIVIGFPGAPCHWYKNPGKADGEWKAYVIQDSACNETPIYTDLLGMKRKGLILGHKGEMAFFTPGKDPTQPWTRIAISGPKAPGTDRYSHGLGAGDVNGDGKLDVMCASGWWEQPGNDAENGNWKFHPLKLGACADMYAFDIDGDGKNDILSSSAHGVGLWWHQQKEGKDHPNFITNNLFAPPADLAKVPADLKLSKDETELFAAINKLRTSERKVPWRLNPQLCRDAKSNAVAASEAPAGEAFQPNRVKYAGEIVAEAHGTFAGAVAVAQELFAKRDKLKLPGLELGIGVVEGNTKKIYLVLVGDNDQFALPAQTHALHFVDIDGDGLKDLVTGRRYWAHGPNRDHSSADPAFLYWFKAKKDKAGFTTFEPQMIDDDSGIGTQFAVEDVDGDGRLDVVVSNKKGVFIFLQTLVEVIRPVPPPPADE